MLKRKLFLGISVLFITPSISMASNLPTDNNLPNYMVPVNQAAMQDNPQVFKTYKTEQTQKADTQTTPNTPVLNSDSNSNQTNLSLPGSQTAPIAANTAEGTKIPPTPNDLAFGSALNSLSPMSPDQIMQFRKYLDQTQKAEVAPVTGNPTVVSRAITLNLQPGEKQPLIHLYAGNATAITFADITGAPWDVTSVTSGNPSAYQPIEAGNKDSSTNMVVISPLKPNAEANNLIVTLKNYPVPIIFSLVTGTDTIDSRVDITITARGPNAAPDMLSGGDLAATNDPIVQNFIDGLPPKEATALTTSNSDVQAWILGNNLYVRTPLTLVSPAYNSHANNVSGMSVYTLENTPILLFSKDGKMISVTLTN